MASIAAFFRSTGAGKSGNPCARLTALCIIARRVISRITDSVKLAVRSLRKVFAGAAKDMKLWSHARSIIISFDMGSGERAQAETLDARKALAILDSVSDAVAAFDREW